MQWEVFSENGVLRAGGAGLEHGYAGLSFYFLMNGFTRLCAGQSALTLG